MDQGSGWVTNLAAISGAKLGAVGGESTDTVGDATPGQGPRWCKKEAFLLLCSVSYREKANKQHSSRASAQSVP